MSIKDKLKKYGKTFKTAKQRAKEEGGFGENLPDGKYLTKLESCEVGESQSSGRLQMTFVYKITDGEQEGESIRKYLGLETEDDQVWLDRELKRFGLEIESLEEVEEVAKILNDSEAEVKVTLKTKDSGQFAYVDKVLSDIDAGDFVSEDSEDDSDDEDSEEETDDVDEDIYEDNSDEEEEEEESEDNTDEDSEEEEDESEEDEGVDLTLGMTVGFEGKNGKEITGKLVKILEKEGTVKISSNGKTYTVEASSLFIPEVEETEDEVEEEEEEVEEVKPKAKENKMAKKVAPAKKAAAKKTVSKKK